MIHCRTVRHFGPPSMSWCMPVSSCGTSAVARLRCPRHRVPPTRTVAYLARQREVIPLCPANLASHPRVPDVPCEPRHRWCAKRSPIAQRDRFALTASDLLGRYTPPDVGQTTRDSTYTYDKDKLLVNASTPRDGVAFTHDGTGRVLTGTVCHSRMPISSASSPGRRRLQGHRRTRSAFPEVRDVGVPRSPERTHHDGDLCLRCCGAARVDAHRRPSAS